MALSIYFKPKSMSTSSYDEIIQKLEEAGEGAPKGRLHHTCFGEENNLNVLDIWDTMENFEKFGQILMPILQQVGVDPGEPEIKEVHNIIEG